jgi:hypothetical protein
VLSPTSKMGKSKKKTSEVRFEPSDIDASQHDFLVWCSSVGFMQLALFETLSPYAAAR